MPTKKPKGIHFCITLNNYAEDDCEKLRSIDWIKYAVVGREVGESGTKHLQGYIQTARSKCTTESGMAKKLLKAGLSSQPHVELSKGTPEEASDYCKKDGDYEEWGAISLGKGSRRDIKTFLKAAETSDELDLAREHPKEYAKYFKAAERVRVLAEERREKEALKSAMDEMELREWQVEAIDLLEKQCDRKVHWYVDYKGGQGKTFLAKHLIAYKGAFYMQGGKVSDIAHAYKGEEYVVCDFTRDKEETVQYSAIESLKNGIIFSPKYDSRTKIKAKGAKVIIFSNWDPDKSKLSEDRWMIKHLGTENPWSIARKAAEEDAPDDFKISDEFWFAAED